MQNNIIFIDITIIFVSIVYVMQFQNPTKTKFYQIERAIKQYRTMAQRNLNELNIKVTRHQILLMIQISDKPDISQVDL